ncbi:DinB superfamily protein [Paenibacillus uliginis N3/975]|uniref:DinB superfamily protein n=1 Tax=Paenibacillus uliginis N3/975 TaxID=1313296 RepID=A0A1X7HHW7_9BACL|nr:DinB family protein [Paenibacillus uliginis]SMF86925.1 DinB superfamily protein [Paenibacillus uliginis N3/975]
MLKRPSVEDYPEYYRGYVGLVPEGDLVCIIEEQQKVIEELISSLSDIQANHRYAPGKWSLKEVFGHMIDAERIMSYRLLRIARGDQTPLAGFNEDFFVENADFYKRSMTDLLEEYMTVRQSTLALVRGLPEESWDRKGIANEKVTSASALVYIIAGHELHHLNIMKDRYLE